MGGDFRLYWACHSQALWTFPRSYKSENLSQIRALSKRLTGFGPQRRQGLDLRIESHGIHLVVNRDEREATMKRFSNGIAVFALLASVVAMTACGANREYS